LAEFANTYERLATGSLTRCMAFVAQEKLAVSFSEQQGRADRDLENSLVLLAAAWSEEELKFASALRSETWPDDLLKYVDLSAETRIQLASGLLRYSVLPLDQRLNWNWVVEIPRLLSGSTNQLRTRLGLAPKKPSEIVCP
jgi:hypothetical protein